ncbi:winged helix-turn-helix transcriptional regulator [Nocardia mexicana]|uniref:HxlR family transcriptional regulator n=1 Tax=Nocardia mexicana TaxID=279262 RepID=A0A370GRY6_9NOCA|nr:winged helix-turn-helix transcriptional regulator [Nocardia mexicana]RDI44703.1 HxlR family transcriptional regulator [Nocardia mexicana]
MPRSYRQYCGLSRSLDLIGERWTMLIVRELMSGPKRFSDLAEALDGIGASLLAARLKQLTTDGLITRRTLPAPAASQVYDLTPAGHELSVALVPLALWGLRHRLDEPRQPDERYRAEWTLAFLAALIDRSAVADLRASIQFRLDDSHAALSIDHGVVSVRPGDIDNPDVVITTDLRGLADLAAHRSPDPAAVFERVTVEGDAGIALRLFELLARRGVGV